MHDFGVELSVREVCKLPLRTASWAVLQQQGLSVKARARLRLHAPP